jgi:endoribonuclease Dicer
MCLEGQSQLTVCVNSCVYLQKYGYTHKNKSLEEILHDARKKEPELLGYNEEPLKVEADICEEIKSLQISRERDANISFQNTEVPIGEILKPSNQRTAGDTKFFKADINNGGNNQLKVGMHNDCRPKGTQKTNKKEYHGNAKSHKISFSMHCYAL